MFIVGSPIGVSRHLYDTVKKYIFRGLWRLKQLSHPGSTKRKLSLYSLPIFFYFSICINYFPVNSTLIGSTPRVNLVVRKDKLFGIHCAGQGHSSRRKEGERAHA